MQACKREYFTRSKYYDHFFSGKRILWKFAKAITKIKLEDLQKPDMDYIGYLQVAEIVATVTSLESSSGTT